MPSTAGSSETYAGGGAGLPHRTGGRRLDWTELPRPVTRRIERVLGDEVTAATSQQGGFSEGLAARLRLAGGGRAFVKAASSRTSPVVAAFHRREIVVSGGLPEGTPAPRLLGADDDGDWVVLVLEDVDGRLPAQPWRGAELRTVLDALPRLAEVLTPSPILRPEGPPRLGGWREIAGSPALVDRLERSAPWATRHVDRAASWETAGGEAVAGETLLHGDLFPSNLLLTSDGVVFVDWPHAWTGAAHCDLVTLMISVELSGLSPEDVVRDHPLTARLDPDRLTALLALQSGFLLRNACLAGPDADQGLVDTLLTQGLASLRWLVTRL